ncbi:D-alanine--D-alanine ligase family protein [Candidatus Merdisoma sp. HCP28S3_D10]|uniref:D-alanine--D-alanine ligase family protein n=1 Tax=unclassified Candidatus Merdisoma TaxID=3099611 RepID=UPI003F896DC7
MKIVVLAGGTSTERDVSLISGSNIYRALKKRGHEAILVDLYLGYEGALPVNEDLFKADVEWDKDVTAISAEQPDLSHLKELRKDGGKSLFGPNVLTLCNMADIVFLGLHGANGEDGRVQAAFDLMGIPYTGTGYLSSALAMDKSLSKQLFRAAGIPTPKGITAKNGQQIDPASVPYPCMVKTTCGGSSVGTYRVEKPEDLPKALDDAYSFGDDVIIEQFVSGREFSVGVVDGKAYPIIEIAPIHGFYDYKNKYQAGSTIETCPADLPADLTRSMQHYAEMVFEALGMRSYARMDFMLDTETLEMYCLEANTLPGMTPTSLLPQEAAALGMSFEDLCEELIRVSLKHNEV